MSSRNGSCTVRFASSLPQRLLRMVQAAPMRPHPGRCCSPGADPDDLYAHSRHIWRAPRPCRASRAESAVWPQAGRPAHARGPTGGGHIDVAARYHGPRPRGPASAGSGAPAVHDAAARSALGRRHHVCADPQRLAVLGRRPGCVLAGEWWAGRWARCWRPCSSGRAEHDALDPSPDIQRGTPFRTAGHNTRAWPSGGGAGRPAWCRRWAARVMRTTTR